MEDPAEHRPKRSKRDTSYKSKAFEKFKQLKNGIRNKYEVEELESVYETVEESEYTKRVLERQDDDWIVDDDGSGYVEDGRDIFDDDLDAESIAKAANSKNKGTKRKKKALSESAGKGNLSYMISNMPSKKKPEVKIDEDDMLAEILGELNDDIEPSCSSTKAKPVEKVGLQSRKQIAKEYMKSFSVPTKRTNNFSKSSIGYSSSISINYSDLDEPSVSNKVNEESIQCSKNVGNEEIEKPKGIEDSGTPDVDAGYSEDLTIEETPSQDMFDDDIDMTQIEEFDSQSLPQKDINEEKDFATISDDIQAEFAQEWGNLENINVDTIALDKSDLPLVEVDGKKIFRFFWWDAYEDAEKQKGTVFLFGKTFCDTANAFVSCCVAVRNLQRQLFVLPRPFELDDNGQPTDKPITYKELYSEFNQLAMKPLQISEFRTRYVSKKYAFNPEIPTESDYMEVRYSASEPRLDLSYIFSKKPKTFSKIFGLNTSYLEIFLLERKIKGPCWLDIMDPVPVSNPLSWCKFEVNCLKQSNVHITKTEKPMPPPPLVVTTINLRSNINPKTYNNEIVMISCITQTKYALDKQAPNPPFNQHFCVFTCPSQKVLPLNMHEALQNYKATKVQKMDTEKALLNYFVIQFNKIDPDLVVGHDLQGYQMNIIADRLTKQDNKMFSKMSRLKRSEKRRLDRELFTGRLVCDIKISAKELIKSRSYDLDTLCQSVLKIGENQRIDFESEDIPKMFQNRDDVLKLITFTMQDTMYILKIMYDLNVIPLALQITTIAGNVMSRTLMGGRSERNEFLLLHAFSEKGYIVPDKEFKKKNEGGEKSNNARKKPTYSGGLVLEPKVGFYDKLILLMDFNSLYPSIIQEYNICFTTLPITNTEENLVLPDKSLPSGILPTEIRKLVESRRQVKGLMNNSDISNDLHMQYHIRQMALKLTANSMYGCLGFSNSRFYAKNLAALVTHKGREILTNTRDLVQKMCFEVVYGDTDSIMINTNSLDYNQVFKEGVKIKQEVNKLYRQVELDIDGVFKYLLLLKKKKYAAVALTKTKEGRLLETREYKGLDIVRRDWSQLACEAGKFILEHILSDQSPDDRINNIHAYLTKIKEDLHEGKVPLQLLIITKQLTKDPKMYTEKNSLPHVQVALRYNKQSGGHFRAGDTVPYVICEDGTNNGATQRAYHIDEMKNSETLKIDINYYLAHQIHPVVSRICEPIEGTDAFQIAECLGIDTSSFKKPRAKSNLEENVIDPEIKFKDAEKFVFKCLACKCDNTVEGVLNGNIPFLDKCVNSECTVRPVDYLWYIQNQLQASIREYIRKYYRNVMTCEDPACTNETRRLPLRFVSKYPVCTLCQKGVMYRLYTEHDLYTQLSYFLHIFNFGKLNKRPLMEFQVESGYHTLKETVEKYLNHSGYSIINLTELFQTISGRKQKDTETIRIVTTTDIELDEDDDEEVI